MLAIGHRCHGHGPRLPPRLDGTHSLIYGLKIVSFPRILSQNFVHSLTKSKEIVYCQAGEVTDLDAVIAELARLMDLKSLDEVMSLSASLSLELDGFSSAGTDVVRGYSSALIPPRPNNTLPP